MSIYNITETITLYASRLEKIIADMELEIKNLKIEVAQLKAKNQEDTHES